MNKEFYTLHEVADLLKISYMTVFRWVKAGKLEAYQIGKQYRVKQSTINTFIEKKKVKV